MGIGSAGVLGTVYLATVLMSQIVAHNAAAAMAFPIAMDAADRAGIDHLLMAYAIMLASSAAFMTPFGYQTNLSKLVVLLDRSLTWYLPKPLSLTFMVT